MRRMTTHDPNLEPSVHEEAVAHGHDDHAHDERALGPIDVAAWGAGALGVLLGAVVAICFVLATASPG
jgi:hypothetical protein